MRNLSVAPGLKLPGDVVTEPLAWLGNRGSGKTYGAKVAAEEMLKAGAQIAVLDPVDAWWGLRYGPERGTSGLPVYVFGGAHGDMPLEATAGELMADVLVESGVSVVLSLRHLPKAAQRRFAAEFLTRLYFRKGEEQYRSPLHVFIEEAHTFAPQTHGKGEGWGTECLGAVQDVVLQGRQSGLGVSLITQRVAVLAKAVLELAEALFAFRTTGPNARKALAVWFAAHDDEEGRFSRFVGDLPRLPGGECWCWSPGYLDLFERLEIRKADTFDSSATPKPGERTLRPKGTKAELDLDALGTRMDETRERVVANDPKRLKARVAELERQLENHQHATVVPKVEEVPVPYVPAEVIEGLEAFRDLLAGQAKQLVDGVAEFQRAIVAGSGPLTKALGDLDRVKAERTSGTAPARRGSPAHRDTPRPSGRPPVPDPPPCVADGDGLAGVRPGARRILAAVAQYPHGATHGQIAALAKVKRRGGSWSSYLSALRQRGLITTTKDRVEATEAGKQYAGVEPIPQGRDEVIAYWSPHLRPGARRMLAVLAERAAAGTPVVGRAFLGAEAQVDPNGGSFSSYLSALRTADLIEDVGQDVALAEHLR